MTTDKIIRLSLPLIAGAGCMIGLLSAMTAVAEWRDASPRVGDIMAFVPSDLPGLEAETRLVVQTPDRSRCVLDLGTVRHLGGSLVVERRVGDDGAQFVVHWAGLRTSSDSADCGTATDLVLDKAQIDSVSAALAEQAI